MTRDEIPPAPGMFNGTHNMPGESGMPWDPAMKRARDERESREKEDGVEHNEPRDTHDGWEQTQEDVKARAEARTDGASTTTRCMHESMGMEDIDMEFRLDGYSNLDEGVM